MVMNKSDICMLRCATIIVIGFGCLKLVDCGAGYDDIKAMNIFGFASLVLNVSEWCLYLLIPVCLLGKKSRWLYCGLFAVVFVLTLIQWYTRLNFDMILTGNWVGIVLNSSRDEIVRYFTGALTVGNVALMLLTVVVFVSVEMGLWRVVTLAPQASWRMRFVGAALLACFLWRGHADPIGAVLGGGTSSTLATGTFRSRNYYVALADLQNKPKLPKTLRYSGRVECPPVMVFVLGESATKNRWSLYGYEKQTTPCLNALKDEVVVFEDLVGSASSTDLAMQMLFTEFDQGPAAKMNCTFTQILNAAGYQCSLFSNQTRWGIWGGVEPFMFSGCSVMKFMGEEGHPKPIYDEVLILYLSNALAELPNKPSAIFIHLYGSHFPPPTCYPKTFSRFAGEKLISLDDTNVGPFLFYFWNVSCAASNSSARRFPLGVLDVSAWPWRTYLRGVL